MKSIPFWFPLCLAVFVALFGSVFFPYFRVIALAPFLAFVYTRYTLLRCLWIASLCGLLLDLTTSQLHFGIYALIYTFATLIAHPQKRHFFVDKPLALSIYSAITSAIISLFQLFFLCFIDKKLPFNAQLILSDLFIMPLLDGLYALLWFTLPFKIYTYIQKQDWKTIFRNLQK